MRIFNIDSGFNGALGKIADMVILSICWLVCCLPVVTIGAATSALYYASMKNHLGEGTIIRNFFRAFVRDFKQSLLLELIVVAVAGVLIVDLYVLPQMDIPLGGLVQVVLTVVAVLGIAMLSYLFPLVARYENTMAQRFQNAVFMSLMNFHYTLLIVAINCAPLLLLVLMTDLFLSIIPLLVLIWPGMCALINAKLFLKIFKQYENQPEEELQEQAAEE